MGTAPVLANLGTSLKPRHVNPHATLITSYMHAVEESAQYHNGGGDYPDFKDECRRIAPYVVGSRGADVPPSRLSIHNREFTLMTLATRKAVGRDLDSYFDRYVNMKCPRARLLSLPLAQRGGATLDL